MSTITPGLHDFSCEFYLSDPCPQPSLDSRGIRVLLESSPAHFMAGHPRLTRWPDQLKSKQRDESLGAIVRALVLNKGYEVAALPFDDWTTKPAQFQRRQARMDGKIPATRAVYDEASSIASHVPNLAGTPDATLIWKRPVLSATVHSIWCRERIDLLDRSSATLVHTVGRAAGDAEIAKTIADKGLDLKAAWVLEGLYGLLSRGSTRMPEVSIVTIEIEPPYLVITKRLSNAWLDDARARIRTAVDAFARGLATKQWLPVPSSAPLEQPPRRTI